MRHHFKRRYIEFESVCHVFFMTRQYSFSQLGRLFWQDVFQSETASTPATTTRETVGIKAHGSSGSDFNLYETSFGRSSLRFSGNGGRDCGRRSAHSGAFGNGWLPKHDHRKMVRVPTSPRYLFIGGICTLTKIKRGASLRSQMPPLKRKRIYTAMLSLGILWQYNSLLRTSVASPTLRPIRSFAINLKFPWNIFSRTCIWPSKCKFTTWPFYTFYCKTLQFFSDISVHLFGVYPAQPTVKALGVDNRWNWKKVEMRGGCFRPMHVQQ